MSANWTRILNILEPEHRAQEIMGRTTEQKILDSLQGIVGVLTPSTNELSEGWLLAPSNPGGGAAMLRFGDQSSDGFAWVAPRAGIITALHASIDNKVTYDTVRLGITRKGVDFYGGAAATLGSGATVANATTLLAIYAGDRLTMIAGSSSESFAPLNSTLRGSFEVVYA